MSIRPEDWKGHCVVCGKDFVYPDFKCQKLPGNHRVETKAYYHLGGQNIANPKERKSWGPQVVLISRSQTMDPESGKMVDRQSLIVQFQAPGILHTDNPEEQFYLETRIPSVGWGPAGMKRWQAVYLTDEQRKQLTEAELHEAERKLSEANSLLAETQKRVAGRSRVEA